MEESAVNEYASSLNDLTTNSKPQISMLTILAEENKAHAAKIAQVIQKYLEKSPTKIKLLSLYLIDSIVKNVGEPYIQLFAENLVPMFTEVFERGDEKVRAALFKLRQTWKGIFSESKLYLVDISTKRMDPQWPITTTGENLRAPIHLNPKFFLRQTNGVQEQKTSQASDSIIDKGASEKTSRRQTNIEDLHKSDGEHPQVLKANTEAEKRADPRLRKKESGDRKHSSKSSSRHEESSEKHRSTSKSSSRSSAQKSDHKKSVKRTSDDASASSLSLEPSMADKEAAAILSGDVDLRLLAPVQKKLKREAPPVQDLPVADVDLRIRPTALDAETRTSGTRMKTERTDEEDDSDQAAQWAKVKGASLGYSTESVSPNIAPNSLPTPMVMPMSIAQPESMDSLLSDRSIKSNINPEISHSSLPKNKSVRVSDPAPDSGQIRLDGRMREVRFVDGVAVAIIDEMPPNFVRARQIMFRGGTKKIIINESIEVLAAFDGREHDFNLNGNRHRIRFGAPLRELYIDGIPYACQFNGVPIYVRSREDVFSVTLHPPCPSVNDKMEATPELLNKLGLKPLLPNPTTPFVGVPFQGMHSIPGHLPLNGANTGGWIRYQEDIRAPANMAPPAMFPPLPTNLGPLAQHTGFQGPNIFCPPPHLGPPYGAYPPPPMLPPGNLPIAAVPSPIPPVPAPTSGKAPVASDSKLNVSDLLSKLVNAGIIGSGEKSDAGGVSDLKSKEAVKEEIPRLTFKQPDLLKKRYNGVISALHGGMQCATCGQRFTQEEKNSDKYAQHLDWHFRSARRERGGLKKASSRKWFYEISDWMLFEEVEDVDDRARSYFEIQEAQHDNASQENETSDVQEIPTVSAKLVDQNENSCFLCHEAFELFFCEETEEWRLRNAVMHDGKVFHPNCYEDFIRPPPEPIVAKEEPTPSAPENMGNGTEVDVPETSAVCEDDTSQPLPGLDFAPPAVREVLKEEKVEDEPGEDAAVDDAATAEEPMDTTETGDEQNDTLQLAEQTVIVEELGEFGVDTEPSAAVAADEDSTQNSEIVDAVGLSGVTSPENVSQDSQAESKVIVKGSGGIVLKVNHDSVASGDAKAFDDTVVEAEPEPEEEWKPPTPDPAYKNFPAVKKGTEESGLCSIM